MEKTFELFVSVFWTGFWHGIGFGILIGLVLPSCAWYLFRRRT